MGQALSLDDFLRLRIDLSPDAVQILAHENTASLDPYFNEGRFVTLPALTADMLVVEFPLPAGNLGLLRAVAMQAPTPSQLDDILWRVRFNRVAIHGLDKIRGPMSTALFPLNVDMGMYDGYIVDIVATNLSAVDITGVFGMVRGNFFGRDQRIENYVNQVRGLAQAA